MFNTEDFLSNEQDGAIQTSYIGPDDGEYPATIDKVDFESFAFQDKKTGQQRKFNKLVVTWKLEDGDGRIKAKTGFDSAQVRQDIPLDLTDNGSLDAGTNKNIKLGQLRLAIGLGNPSQKWSFKDFPGKSAKVVVETEMDNKDASKTWQRVNKVFPL